MEEKKFYLEFIKLYQSFPALWNTFSKEYCDRKLKYEQYSALLEKYKEWDPEASQDDMKKKINTLRTNYRREMKRLDKLNKSGAGANESSEPNLYYYSAMDFLRNCETPRRSKSTMALDIDESSIECETPIKRRKNENLVDEELLALAKKELCKSSDDFDRFGEICASKIRKMEKTQQIWAEKFINEILLEGQLGTLHRYSVKIKNQETTSLNIPNDRSCSFSDYESNSNTSTSETCAEYFSSFK